MKPFNRCTHTTFCNYVFGDPPQRERERRKVEKREKTEGYNSTEGEKHGSEREREGVPILKCPIKERVKTFC